MAKRKIATRNLGEVDLQRELPWRAFYEGMEDAGNFGVGMTEEEAIKDFEESCQFDHDRRLEQGE